VGKKQERFNEGVEDRLASHSSYVADISSELTSTLVSAFYLVINKQNIFHSIYFFEQRYVLAIALTGPSDIVHRIVAREGERRGGEEEEGTGHGGTHL
jgi:hypothetical protein